MNRSTTKLLAIFAMALSAVPAAAGPDWEEICDAGSTISLAQPVAGGIGSVQTIRGSLGACSPLAGVDLEDVYLINIQTPMQFCAKTVVKGEVPGCCMPCPPDCVLADQGTNFNTQLWLFSASGHGLLGNDDDPVDPPRSRIGNASDDGTGITVTTPGLYYLAISGGPDRIPVSVTGPIFQQAIPTEVSGPDGLGGLDPLNGWTGPGLQGDYEIVLCGVQFIEAIPTVTEWSMAVLTLVVAAAGMILARRMPSA
jgi:hypothetical protein